MRLVAGVVTAVVLATGGGIAIGWNLARAISDHSSVAAQIHTVAPLSPSPGTSTQSAPDKVIPAVVDINTVVQTGSGTGEAAGTGLILDSNGDVLTNNHVVEGSISLSVAIQGRNGTYKADVVGVDPTDDVAVIHIENVSGLPTVTLAESSALQVGDAVYAIGNALGQGGTPRVTQGHITALDQTITASENGSNSETLNGMIQSDAEISPGDSGGALANGAGQVVGMITAGEATSFRTTSSAVGYAIPSSTAADVANRILNGQAGNGIFIGPVGYLGVSVPSQQAGVTGVLISGAQPGSPAQAAGLTDGSVITAVNGTSVDSPDALGKALHQHKPGDRVTVTWTAPDGSSHTATVTLVSGPAI
jgi:S1-C subfamily serine protease